MGTPWSCFDTQLGKRTPGEGILSVRQLITNQACTVHFVAINTYEKAQTCS